MKLFLYTHVWFGYFCYAYTRHQGGGILKESAFVLEYRLWKGNEQFTPLYYYEHIELEQILARRECEFFVKNGVTYKQVSSAIEEDIYVIYVEIFEEEPSDSITIVKKEDLVLEIRELNVLRNHPVVKTLHFQRHLDVLSIIGSTFIYVNQQEWLRDSAELDEDRMLYVLYSTPTDYEWKE